MRVLGRPVPSSTALVIGFFLLALAVAYPLAWALTAEQEAKLLAADGGPGDGFGLSVALDGDTAIIGTGLGNGPAYVFTRTASVWTEQAQLRAADGESGNFFASSVAIDGDTALIGAYGDNDNGWWSGAAYVFTREKGTWTEQGKLLASDGESGDYFGMSVALDDDTAIVGMGQGEAAYVFTRTLGVWTEQAKLLATDGEPGEGFGWGAEIDGDTAIIGTSWGEAAYVFTRTGKDWNQQARLQASDGQFGDYFGWGVAVDGDTALIGAYGDDDNGSWSGAAYVFTRAKSAWTEHDKLLASDGQSGDYFGMSVALDGDTSLIGSSFFGGAAYIFTRAGGVWSEQAKLLPTGGNPGDGFGWSVALAGDRGLVGASLDSDNGGESGAAYVFRLGPADEDEDGDGDEDEDGDADEDGEFDDTSRLGGGNRPDFDFKLTD